MNEVLFFILGQLSVTVVYLTIQSINKEKKPDKPELIQPEEPTVKPKINNSGAVKVMKSGDKEIDEKRGEIKKALEYMEF